MTGPTRVLVVDDSAFVRKVVRQLLTAAGMEVVGHARNGLEALELVDQLRPDVMTLDLMMPHLGGLDVLEQLASRERPPAVVVVSVSGADSEVGVEALQRGAVAVVEKPTALATGRLYELGEELVSLVRTAAEARPALQSRVDAPRVSRPPARRARRAEHVDLVVLGTSTGGPQALTRLLSELPEDFPVPLAVVLHIPAGYTAAMAERLDLVCACPVVEASDGMIMSPGTVTIARAGMHLEVARGHGGLEARLGLEPLATPHRPSVDVLFESAARTCGARTLAVVLTGMGEDGLAGARALRAKGARILTESESSCVVWGMPRMVWEAGLADAQRPLSEMVDAIFELL